MIPFFLSSSQVWVRNREEIGKKEERNRKKEKKEKKKEEIEKKEKKKEEIEKKEKSWGSRSQKS